MLNIENIGYEMKVINARQRIVSPINGLYTNFTNFNRIFIKVSSSPSYHNYNTIKKLLNFYFYETSNSQTYIEFKVYKLNVNYTDSNATLYNSLNNPTNLIDRKVYKLDELVDYDRLKNIEIDISDIPNTETVLGVLVTAGGTFNLVSQIDIKYTKTLLDGLDNLSSLHTFSLTNYDKAYVNLSTGNMFNEFELLNIIDDKLPFNLSLIHNPNNLTFEFNNRFTLNITFFVFDRGNDVVIKNYSGNELYFRYILLGTIEEYEKLYKELGIVKPSDVTNHDFYYCTETGDYFFTYSFNQNFTIYDHNQNKTTLKVVSMQTDYKVYSIDSIVDKYNHTISFSYSGGKLVSITTNEQLIVNFTYNNGLIASISCDKLNKQVNFEYGTNSLIIKYIFNYVIIDVLEIVYSGDYITQII